MIQIFFITTLSAIVIGVIVYFGCNKEPKKLTGEEWYKNHISKCLVPEWMEKLNESPLEKGDRIICIRYGLFGLTGEVTGISYYPVTVSGQKQRQAGAYITWDSKSDALPSYVNRNHVIKIQDSPKIEVNHNKCESKKIKYGATVIAEYFMCYQRIIIEGKLLGYNQFGQPVISTLDCGQIIVAKNILKEVIKKPKK